jgi:Tfp pilus assembly protein PilO
MLEQFKALKLNLGVVFIPSVMLVMLFVLFLISIRVGLPRIVEQRRSLKILQDKAETLEEKRSRLEELRVEYTSQVDPVATAFPDKLPSLLIVSQTRKSASEKDLEISEVDARLDDKYEFKGNEAIVISFTVAGDFEEILDFILSTKNLAPITTLEEIELSNREDNAEAEVKIAGYWSPYPQTLPAVDEPIDEITPEEKLILNRIAALTQPEFFDVPALPPSDRSNPFSFSD